MQQIYLSVKIDLRKPLLISVVMHISEVDIFCEIMWKAEYTDIFLPRI